MNRKTFLATLAAFFCAPFVKARAKWEQPKAGTKYTLATDPWLCSLETKHPAGGGMMVWIVNAEAARGYSVKSVKWIRVPTESERQIVEACVRTAHLPKPRSSP